MQGNTQNTTDTLYFVMWGQVCWRDIQQFGELRSDLSNAKRLPRSSEGCLPLAGMDTPLNLKPTSSSPASRKQSSSPLARDECCVGLPGSDCGRA